MREDSEVTKLCKIYREMDTEGKEKIVAAAIELFSVQKTLETHQMSSQASRFTGIPGYLVTVFLLLSAACIFWVTLINPALLTDGITPLLMVRIIITALCGIIIIGAGFVWFIWRKLRIPWMLLAIGAGILCADPRALTDFMGIIILVLIVVAQVISMKRGKTVIVR